MYWVNEWSHTLAVVDAATDTQVQLVPLGNGQQVQPVDIAYNSVNRLVYTANRLTYTIGVLPSASTCNADLDRSGTVDGGDLGAVLSAWGTPAGDVNGDKQTNAADLAAVLSAWGPC
jgi:DNA-binding beta-propeller fold protein YncE